ncbi:MAG TPA: MauE/DoxX family redox-associated membrane protein [Candidatus Dormibacteraeota bacterium]|nr:MauE/DoxX family redox-associated membrane protein [Candidatus Dormibacteraeota bacterium]
MDTLGAALNWLAEWGFIFVVAGAIAALCVRDPVKRRSLVRSLLIVGGIVLGSIFLAAAYGKLKPIPGFPWSWASMKTSIALFAIQVESYNLLSPGGANTVAHILPFAELFLGLWLISGVWRRYSSLLASLVFVGFMIAIYSAYRRGLKIDCGCGVGPPEEAGPAALLRDGMRFLLPALIVTTGAFWLRKQSSASPAAATPESASAVR